MGAYESGDCTGPQETLYIRSDANADGRLDISDAIYILRFLFMGGETPPCLKAADADDNTLLELTDAVFLFNYLWLCYLCPWWRTWTSWCTRGNRLWPTRSHWSPIPTSSPL